MRIMPFMKRKKGIQFAGVGLDTGGGGTKDYDDLSNKPQIGGVTLTGNKTLGDLGAQSALTYEDVLMYIDSLTWTETGNCYRTSFSLSQFSSTPFIVMTSSYSGVPVVSYMDGPSVVLLKFTNETPHQEIKIRGVIGVSSL